VKRRTGGTKLLAAGTVTLLLHAVLIAGAVSLSRRGGAADNTVKRDTTMVFLDQPQQHPAAPVPLPLDVPLQGFQTITVPARMPALIPLVDLTQHFDARDYSGTGVEGGHASGGPPPPNAVYTDASVTEHPALLSSPPAYPQVMNMAGIRGRVVLQAIVDTAGRVEAGSIRILASPNPGFDQPTRQWAASARFRPARLDGRAVRVLVNLPIDFTTAAGG